MPKSVSLVSVVIPTKEEAACLTKTITELRQVFGQHILEILVVDAGSKDGTQKLAESLGCRVLVQPSPGYGAAVQLGLQAAQGELITFFDADGSYDPNLLPKMLEEIAEHDAVFCTRYHPDAGSDDDTWLRYSGNQIFTFLMRRLFGVKLTDALHLYVLARTKVAKQLPMQSQGFEWCVEFPIRLEQLHFHYKEIPARERPRSAGLSKVNAWSDGWMILKALLKWRLTS